MASERGSGGQPAATAGDKVVGVDTHVVMVPSPGGPLPTPTPLPFDGPLSDDLSPDVAVDGKRVALVGSVAHNTPAHVPPNGAFQRPPKNAGTVVAGSGSVFANAKPMARGGDAVDTCNDPADAPKGRIVADGTVFVGD